MAQPVLVRSYTSPKPTPSSSPRGRGHILPPIAAFAFADILRAADSADLQSAIDGIAEICAKNRMSLAEEYGSHLPPVGEITAVSTDSTPIRQQHARLNLRRALTSVPEASSGSSDGSVGGKRRSISGFGPKQEIMRRPVRTVRISKAGRMIPVCGTTAVSMSPSEDYALFDGVSGNVEPTESLPAPFDAAVSRLRHLMAAQQTRPAQA